MVTSMARVHWNRRCFIGGSDARIIMGDDEAALIRLWREKRGEAERRTSPATSFVQLGRATEELNRSWYERNTGRQVRDVQRRVKHSAIPWMAATLDGIVEGIEAVFEAKFMLPWSFSEEAAAEKYMAQLQHNMWVTHLRSSVLSIITGGGKWVEVTIPMDPLYLSVLVSAEKKFWRCVQSGEVPHLINAQPPRPRIEAIRIVAKGEPSAILDGEQSATLRDRLLAEIGEITSTERAASWAQEALAAKNKLAASDAKLIEDTIGDAQRRPEGELWRQFELVRPHILGALLDAVAQGLRAMGHVRLEALPRMADFALWAAACETALWPAGIFARAYAANRRAAIESIMEADPIATCLRSIMAARTTWTGSASDLLRLCAESARERPPGGIAWAKNPRVLAGRLRRAQTFLRTLASRSRSLVKAAQGQE